ncbi:MAG: HvfC/BufC family peptide modification chaperone [Usitatibacter sp.]
MSALALLQREFLAAIFDAAPVSDGGIATYRRNVLGNLHNALASTYPVIERLVGDAFFREAAEQYARACPSVSGDLHEFGASFASFLESYAHAAALAYLPDVARLEWAVHESFHAADGAPLDYGRLGRVAPESYGALRFHLHPAVRFVSSVHPVLAIWEANQPGRDGTPERDAAPERVLVRRDGFVVRPELVGERDWNFLAALDLGATLEEAGNAIGESAEEFLADALARHASAGIIAGFDAPEPAA